MSGPLAADTAKVVFIRAFDGFGLTAAEAHSAWNDAAVHNLNRRMDPEAAGDEPVSAAFGGSRTAG
jgi:hypothetical protein